MRPATPLFILALVSATAAYLCRLGHFPSNPAIIAVGDADLIVRATAVEYVFLPSQPSRANNELGIGIVRFKVLEVLRPLEGKDQSSLCPRTWSIAMISTARRHPINTHAGAQTPVATQNRTSPAVSIF